MKLILFKFVKEPAPMNGMKYKESPFKYKDSNKLNVTHWQEFDSE